MAVPDQNETVRMIRRLKEVAGAEPHHLIRFAAMFSCGEAPEPSHRGFAGRQRVFQ